MRVVSGEARGRRLVTPAGRDTRPTTDRVRESMFNALESLDVVAGAAVLDLFAGSGALGIEALSRGAAGCTFVEHERAALAAVRTNLDATGLAARAEVVSGDAHRALATFAATGRHFDVALLDPPYATAAWERLLPAVPADLVVLESDREVAVPEGWVVLRSRRYGGTVVTFARRADLPAPGSEQPRPPTTPE
jgi:16S rRNA (guanine966-N2)-methyltransferase